MTVQVLGLGSSHGDDRAGWEAIQRLQPHLPAGIAAVALSDPLQMLTRLDGCTRLVIVDACRTGAAPGTILRGAWADGLTSCEPRASTHGLGVAEALGLAKTLGRLPSEVVLYGIEGESFDPGDNLSAPVRAALPELCRRVLEEIDRRPDVALAIVASGG